MMLMLMLMLMLEHQILCKGALPPCCFPLELVHLLQNPQGVRFWCRQQQPLWAGESRDDFGDGDDDDDDGVMMIVMRMMMMVNIMMPITGVPGLG